MIKRLTQTAPVRKGLAFANRMPRYVSKALADRQAYTDRPPIIVNSLPKSGTHLLMQIAERLPHTRNFGSFIAQTPSLTLRLRSQDEIDRKISMIAPGEVVGAHLYYSEETARALERLNALHLFIWRDPRDVLLSEAHYLTRMTRWHAMHRRFAALPDDEARVRMAIVGASDDRYPGAEIRIGAYMPWIASGSCLSIRYEQLVSAASREAVCQEILDAYQQRSGSKVELPTPDQLVDAIDPDRSHTFHRGGVARWKKEMSVPNQALCRERLGEWLAP